MCDGGGGLCMKLKLEEEETDERYQVLFKVIIETSFCLYCFICV